MNLKNSIIKYLCCAMAIIPLLSPFSISADTLTTSNIVGVNRTLTQYEIYKQQTSNSIDFNYVMVSYDFEILLDDYYIGWINIDITQQFEYANSSGQSEYKTMTTPERAYYVNGNSFTLSQTISTRLVGTSSLGSVDPCKYFTPSYNLHSSNITKYQDIDSINQVTSILQDVYNNSENIIGLQNDEITELQNIVTALNLNNQYLSDLLDSRQYNVPIEFIPCVLYSLRNLTLSEDYPIASNDVFYNINVPVFKWKQNQLITDSMKLGSYNSSTDTGYLIFLSSYTLTSSNWQSYIKPSNTNLYTLMCKQIYKGIDSLYVLKIRNNNSSNVTLSFTSNVSNQEGSVLMNFISNKSNGYELISTELATLLGIDNVITKNIKYLSSLYNGTPSSNSSSNSLNTQTNQFNTDSNNLITLEESMNTDMNTYLQQIDTNFDVGNQFGSKFLTSAEWVRNQYNTLTSNTPFGTFISFSLLIGLALLLMGRLL